MVACIRPCVSHHGVRPFLLDRHIVRGRGLPGRSALEHTVLFTLPPILQGLGYSGKIKGGRVQLIRNKVDVIEYSGSSLRVLLGSYHSHSRTMAASLPSKLCALKGLSVVA